MDKTQNNLDNYLVVSFRKSRTTLEKIVDMNTTNKTEEVSKKSVLRILAIDDEKDAVDLLELILTRENYLVDKAYTANDAAKVLESGTELPDLILLDVKMPGTDGFTFCQKLKKDQKYKHIPVIILSALTFPDDVRKGYESGAKDYILKPWSNQDLVKRIEQQLSIAQHA
ncbi:MAG: response regulator [Candidatus Hodarchaeales archaeon]|jgi:DNA-binding response OmpR family regulator